MKKIQTLLMMFSLFFLFSFSSAGTVTIKITEFDGTEVVLTEENEEFTTDTVYGLNLPSINNYQVSNWCPNGPEYLIYFIKGKYYYVIYDTSYLPVIAPSYSYGSNNYTFVGCYKSSSDSFVNNITGQLSSNTTSANVYGKSFYTSSSMPRLIISSTDVYEYNVSSCLGSYTEVTGMIGNVIEADYGGTDKLPEMDNPFSNSELVDIYNRLDNSDVLIDYLPKGYSGCFMTYNEETGQYKAYFYHYSGLPYVKVYPEGYVQPDGSNYDYLTYTLGIGDSEAYSICNYDGYLGYSHAFPLYTFVTFGSDSDFWFHSTIEVQDLPKNIISFDNCPIIFSSEDIPIFYLDELGDVFVKDDGSVDSDYINIFPETILTDEETGEDIIIGPTINDDKDTESLWILISSIPSKIIEGIKSIFIPSYDFLTEKANSIIYKFSFYTSLVDTFQQFIDAITVDSNGAPVVSVDFSLSEDSVLADCGSANILDFSWYEPFKPLVDLFIIAFVYGVFLYRFINELPNTIAGISQAFDYMPLSKDSAYSGSGKIGFKAPGGDEK